MENKIETSINCHKIKVLSIIFILLYCTSCTSIAKTINGESKQQLENHESLSSFLEENQIDIDLNKTFFFDRKKGMEALYNFKPYNVNRVSNPDIYLFDNDLFLIDDTALGGCIYDRPSPEGKDFYKAIYEVNVNKTHVSSLTDLKGKLINYKGESYFPFNDKSEEKVMFIVWSKYKGKKFIKSQIDYTFQTLRKTSEKFQIYFLNVDDYQY